MPTRSARLVVPLALFAALLVVSLNTWFAVAAVQDLLQSESWLAHTWEVVGENEHLMTVAVTAESAARGYVLTGRELSYNEATAAIASLPREAQHLQDLTIDNAVQQENLAEVRRLLSIRTQTLQRVMELRREQGLEAAQSTATSGQGAEQMAQFRNALEKIEAEERHLLANRAEQAQRNGWRTLFAIGLACAIDILMIGAVSYYFSRERTLRLASQETAQRLAVARAEAERSAAEVQTLNAELENRVRERTAELEATNRELEAFSYSVSHDLRAPLRTIDGFSLALEEDYAEAVDATGRDYIRRVRAGVQRMGQLIDALLQLSRITRADLTRESVDVAAIARTVAAALREENAERKLTFEIAAGPAVDADPKLVQVALENLLGNAVKFTARRPEAKISVTWDAAAKAWRVQDNGAGFDMQYAHKLFNAFNRLHGDKDFKGSGIGLATVARVVRRHGGRIWADSTVDHGATFWFTLG